jgi:hypothetical protein
MLANTLAYFANALMTKKKAFRNIGTDTNIQHSSSILMLTKYVTFSMFNAPVNKVECFH